MFRTYFPKALWNYGIPYVAKIMQITASFASDLQGRTPLEALTGETPDISQYLDFGFYKLGLVQRRCMSWRDQTRKIHRSLPLHRISHELLGFASKWNTDVQNNRTTSHKFGITNRTMKEIFLRCTADPLQKDSMRYKLKVTSLTLQTTNPTESNTKTPRKGTE